MNWNENQIIHCNRDINFSITVKHFKWEQQGKSKIKWIVNYICLVSVQKTFWKCFRIINQLIFQIYCQNQLQVLCFLQGAAKGYQGAFKACSGRTREARNRDRRAHFDRRELAQVEAKSSHFFSPRAPADRRGKVSATSFRALRVSLARGRSMFNSKYFRRFFMLEEWSESIWNQIRIIDFSLFYFLHLKCFPVFQQAKLEGIDKL